MCHLHLKLCTPTGAAVLDTPAVFLGVLAFAVHHQPQRHRTGLFKPCAKKYDIDFTLRKDRTTHPPRYIVIFKSKQADNLEQAFKEFTAKKQQKRIPQITTRLEQIDKVLNKLYEDNALGTIPQDRYEQMSQKYSEEYYVLKAELATLQEQLSAYENAGGRAQKFLKLTERHAAFTDLTPP
jgi:hypothetical protein